MVVGRHHGPAQRIAVAARASASGLSQRRSRPANGRLDPAHLEAAAGETRDPELAAHARVILEDPQEPSPPTLQRLALVTDLRDLHPGPIPGRTWTEFVVHQIGQHCAAHFDEWQASWTAVHGIDLFQAWRNDPAVTHGFT